MQAINSVCSSTGTVNLCALKSIHSLVLNKDKRTPANYAGELYELYCELTLGLQKWKNYCVAGCADKFGTKDYGIDLASDAPNGEAVAYQCKNWAKNLCYGDLATFFAYSQICKMQRMVVLYTLASQKPIPLYEGWMKFRHVPIDETVLKQLCDTPMPPEPEALADPPLRQCQLECLAAMRAAQLAPNAYDLSTPYNFEYNIHNFQLYCGTGKSRVIQEFVAEKSASANGILILVPSLLLVAQMGNRIEGAVLVGTGFTDCVGGNDNQQTFKERVANAHVVVCCYNSVGLLDRYFEYVIIDEAHHVFKPQIFEEMVAPLDDEPELLDADSNHEFGTEGAGEEVYEEELDTSPSPQSVKPEDMAEASAEAYLHIIRHGLYCDYVFCFSATLDNDGPLDYNYTMQQAIDDKVVVDYTLNILLFDGDEPNAVNNIYNIDVESTKCLIYCNSIAQCAEIAGQLGCGYLDGQMNDDKRQRVIGSFRDDEAQRFLASCRTLSEGVDMPFVDSVLFFDERQNQIDIIQCIGRAQRLFAGKTTANVYVLANAGSPDKIEDEVQRNLSKYCRLLFDFDRRVAKKIVTKSARGRFGVVPDVVERESQCATLVQTYCQTQCSKLAVDKLELCRQFYAQFKRLPTSVERFQGFRIGGFIQGMKVANKNKHIKQQILNIFQLHEFPSYVKFTRMNDEEKIELCRQFFSTHKRAPRNVEQFQNFNIGTFVGNVKRRDGRLRQQVLDAFGLKSFDEIEIGRNQHKLKICQQYYNDHNKLPPQSAIYKGFKIGCFITHLRGGGNAHLKQQVMNIFQIQQLDRLRAMPTLTDGEKLQLCQQFANINNNNYPSKEAKFNGWNIGSFIWFMKTRNCNAHLSPQVEAIFQKKLK